VAGVRPTGPARLTRPGAGRRSPMRAGAGTASCRSSAKMRRVVLPGSGPLSASLATDGVPASWPGRWSPATLRRILIGPHLAGLRVYGEQLYPAAWPALLSEDTHHALRALRHADVRLLPAGQVCPGQDAALPSQARRLRTTRPGAPNPSRPSWKRPSSRWSGAQRSHSS